MNIEAQKISLAQKLFMVQRQSVLDKVDALLTFELNNLTKEQKKAIDLSIESLENGDSITHEQVMIDTKNRYPNLFK